MKKFTSGNLLISAMLKTKLQKIYPILIDNKLKYSIAYLNGNNYSNANVGIASLQKSSLSKRDDFIAFNNLNKRQDINKEDKVTLKNYNFTICLKDEKTLPVKRVGINNLEIYFPQKLGFAKKKANCTERKILSKILRMMQKKRIVKGNLGGTLYLYTKLEPCTYCMTALTEFINETGTQIYLIYEELIFEIVRDNLSYGPTFITNVIEPTNYVKLYAYDPELAEMVRNDYFRRGKDFK